ncbi:hypothetical protein [Streptomyces hainanensis]|uniref:Phage portal protein n=1 Tax=Streptomyces hainanensis TaxID=402648 RepID=A0A4R4TTS6_9ACTN|nr:hypothetical protein [Streptomyces hainanensis]TDC77509.1 hypothetical protein E1283_07165 [Streptomyces hainanensis]
MDDLRRRRGVAASWVPEEDLRRLASYRVLAAYDNNQAGQLSALAGDDEASERREFGDAAKLVETALTYVLGSEQRIVVPGAERADGREAAPEIAAAADLQARLRHWAERELLLFKLQQVERTTVLLGDGVLLLSWDPQKARPRVRSVDPGFFFPVWEDDEDEEFPRRVHLAWELPEDPARGLKARVRRLTYELGPIEGAGGEQVLRTYPCNPDRPSPETCYFTDAEWLLEDVKAGQSIDGLPPNRAQYRVRADGQVLKRLDLVIDFVPIVHLTNTVPASGEHWGQPVLAKVLQGLDELAATDSDSAAASATTGAPIIGLAGARLPTNHATGHPEKMRVQAGAVWQLGESGRMDALDTSSQLAELRTRVEHLLDRIASNSRITAAGLGILDASQVPSGYTLKLSLAPLDALLAQMRLAREHKYRLMLRMVQRLFQAGQADGWGPGPTHVATLTRSAHSLADRAAILDEVVNGYRAGVFSLDTSVRMLMDAGYPIDDASKEIARIQAAQGQAAHAA